MGKNDATALLEALRRDEATVWMRDGVAAQDPEPLLASEVEEARERFTRFEPVLAELFPEAGWNGVIESPLISLDTLWPGTAAPLAKCDHALPVTGSVKARGGVHEVLHRVESVATRHGMLGGADGFRALLRPAAREVLSRERLSVASTGNLGYSVGLVGSALGMAVEVHMSRDAKAWKKARLLRLGVTVREHPCDYAETSARAREEASRTGAYFVDDETSRTLMVGYSVAAAEVQAQLAAAGFRISPDRPLVVYLPCGVGGAPGGIAAGLKLIYGDAVVAVFVEPTRSPCMLAALALNGGRSVSVYELGLDNATVCDGLAVPRASDTVLRAAASAIDAVVAVPDRDALAAVRLAWSAGLRLEPSAASAVAALSHFKAAGGVPEDATHLVWTTGGSQLPDEEFRALVG